MIKVELTEQQRDILWQIVKTLCIVPNPVYESLRDQLHPKKDVVEFDAGGRHIIINSHCISFCGCVLQREDYEAIYDVYTLKKHEVADE